jgi:hypothetical protein
LIHTGFSAFEATQAGISAALGLLSESRRFILRADGDFLLRFGNPGRKPGRSFLGCNLELNWK